MSVSAERRAELERWLAGAAFNSYYHFRVGALGAGECTIEAPYGPRGRAEAKS